MKKMTFAIAALLAASIFVSCAKEKVSVTCAADLAGKKIGVQSGTTGELYVQENVEGARLSSFKSGIDAALDLKTGSIDAVVLDELPAQQIVARNPDLKIIRDQVFTDSKEAYAIAVKKGNTNLLNTINAAIAEMKANGDYEALVNTFMPADGNIVIPEAIATSGATKVKLGTNAAFPPFEYVNGKEIVGFDISMGQRIAAKAEASLEVVDMAFDSLIPALQSGTIDFIAAGMSVTEERKKNVDFSDEYFQSEQVIIVKK
ncbi:MAG: transporter substrate-binding domain-containing protein [Treponema sp.]|nr:transporter substrate-binding domain-containing protein [Treponema sp.]